MGDRESDIYKLFCAAAGRADHFLLRTCVDRIAGDGSHTIADEMAETRCTGLHRVAVHDRHSQVEVSELELRSRRIHIFQPVGKRKRYPEIAVAAINAQERTQPKGREPIDWRLVTDLPVCTRGEAIEKWDWYAMCWKIETFHRILKSGCKAEDSKPRTAQNPMNLIAIFCILRWRILWLTMLNWASLDSKAQLAFTAIEIKLLDQGTKDRLNRATCHRTVVSYLIRLARLGGCLDCASDPPPRNTVIWRGMSRRHGFRRSNRRGTCG